ncbi:MAG: hypothetical protein PHX68_04710, partial [Alphaproteobacteria bacterium]|nr:hypothetical protein [Alphaproteobacteria bacterium]
AVRGDRTGYALMRWTADLPQTAGALNLEATQPILVPVSQQPPEKGEPGVWVAPRVQTDDAAADAPLLAPPSPLLATKE